MRLSITHWDVIHKAYVLLLLAVLSLLVFYLAAGLPARIEWPEGGAVNAVEAQGGRVYSFVPPGDDGSPVIRAALGTDGFEGVSVRTLGDSGVIQGYTMPPGRLVPGTGGRMLVLPATQLADGPLDARVIFTGNPARARVALTFDSSDVREPQARAIMDILAREKAPATFFVCGRWCKANPELLREALARGFEIGNHTNSHPYMTHLSDSERAQELETTGRAFSEVTGKTMAAYWRPPYGDLDSRTAAVAGQAGYITVMWSIDTLDWLSTTQPGQVRDRAVGSAVNGSIVLMHMNARYTPDDLPRIISGLRAKGFDLVTVSGILEP